VRETLEQLRQVASSLGFSNLRVAPAIATQGYSRLVEWLESGFAGQMDYFQNRLSAYRHPTGVLEGVRSIVVLTLPYHATNARVSGHMQESAGTVTTEDGVGKLARYTWMGADYHDVIHAKLKVLAKQLASQHPDCKTRGAVDTAPLLEREFAELAGIGWQAKNTLIINKYAGSYFFLACLLTDLLLPIDAPHPADHCGTCRRCLDACPTDAFPQPGVLDASRCISYLTIEHRGPIPTSLREPMGEWVFGCDVCQEVCPWNQPDRLTRLTRAVISDAANPQATNPNDHYVRQQQRVNQQAPMAAPAAIEIAFSQLSLPELFELDDDQFRQRFRKTPMWRVRRRGLLRNAAIVLGNQRSSSAVHALNLGLNDDEPVVRGASAWALRRLDSETASEFLKARLSIEDDPMVRGEILGTISDEF
jgi:epoxyqueuosine reductase